MKRRRGSPGGRPLVAGARSHSRSSRVVRRISLALAAGLVLAGTAAAAAPKLDARAWLVEDGSTGQVIAGYHARERVPIASITKLMTVLLTLEHRSPAHVVTVAPEAAAVGESSVNLYAGERITVRELLEAALVQSANDAADALAYDVGGGSETRFVALMNARARALGLTDTHYSRPDGLDAPDHVSSARDVTRLARLLMQRPLVRSIVRQRTAEISGGRTLHTWNDLLASFPGVIGVKTGHTSAAGWNEVAALRRPGISLYATLLGSPDRGTRNAELTRLLRWGLSHYGPVRAVVRGHVYAHVDTGYGHAPVALVARAPFTPIARLDRPLGERVVATAAVELPVRRGTVLGEIRVYQGARLLGRRVLVAERSISKPGLVARTGWYAHRTLHHIWGWVS